MKLFWLSIMSIRGVYRQNKLVFWAACREKGDEIHLFWGQIWVIWVKVTPGTNVQLCKYSMTQIARTWRGLPPRLWRAIIPKRLGVGILYFACVHYTHRWMLEMNFSQIWEVTRTNFQDIGWFDTEWPLRASDTYTHKQLCIARKSFYTWRHGNMWCITSFNCQ